MAEGDRKTIILVDNSAGPSGAAKSLTNIIMGLHESFRFVVVARNKSVFTDLEKWNVDVVELPFRELRKSWTTVFYPFYLLFNSVALWRIVRKYERPVLHMNDCYNMCGVMVKIFRPSIRLIYHVRLLASSYIGSLYNFYMTMILKYADIVICNSYAVMNGIRPSEKVIVIHNSMENIEDESPNQLERYTKIVYLGNYMPGKGHIYALHVIKWMKDKGLSFPVFFYGSTYGKKKNENYKNRLIELSRQLGIDEYVNFEGFCKDIKSVIRQSHMVFNFSVSESFSMVCLEAMWYGSLIVAYNSGGPADFIENGKSGILLEPGTSPETAADIIIEIANDTQKKAAMESYAMDYVHRNFSIKQKAHEFYKVYLANA